MGHTFVIEPEDGWHPGDRAYCVRGSRGSKPGLETGKVYRVADVIAAPSHVSCGLSLDGVRPPTGLRGFWSSRFVKLSSAESALRRIATHTTPVWIDAYRASSARRNAGEI